MLDQPVLTGENGAVAMARYLEPGNLMPVTGTVTVTATSRGRGHGDVEVMHFPLFSLVEVRFEGENEHLGTVPHWPILDLCSFALRFCSLAVRVHSHQISNFNDLNIVCMMKEAWEAWVSRLEALEHFFLALGQFGTSALWHLSTSLILSM